MPASDSAWREAVIDLAAITSNVRLLREFVGTEHFIAVVKAGGYGHGATETARAALAGGADWLGVADIDEALALRSAGVEAPILAWLHDPDADFAPAVAAGVSIAVSSEAQLQAVARAAAVVGSRASVQLKLDTGLSRNGVPESEWAAVFSAAGDFERSGALAVDGVFSHVSNTSPSDDAEALAAFERGMEAARSAGLKPALVHLAASAAAISVPSARFNTVRIGIGIYGLAPADDVSIVQLGLTPAMTLRSRIAAVRRVPAGTGVSYGYTYRTDRETTLALIPLGYADGIPRHASNTGSVSIGGRTFTVCGRIAMDQFVVDVGDEPVSVGDPVVIFGDPALGVPSADDWARAAGTINYEIVTRIGPRVARRYVAG